MEPNFIYSPTNFPNGLTTVFNGVTSAPGLAISAAASPNVKSVNGFTVFSSNTLGVPVAAETVMPTLTGPALANDMCRMYTFFCSVNYETGATTRYVLHGQDFSHARPVHPKQDINYTGDINYGTGLDAIIGFLYIKNESGANFVPGTTHLDATGLTVSYGDAFGYPVWAPSVTPNV